MIEVINRELLIPREEYNIGTNYDDHSETRQFHLKRITSGGIDLGNLSFSLDIRYANDLTDTALLKKEVTPRDIVLTLDIVSSMLQVPGSVLIQIRALSADGAVKWTSYMGSFFVEDAINFPASYTGEISEIERLETEFSALYQSEADRVAAETLRAEAEEARVEAEEGRVEAEAARVLAEEARVQADERREEEHQEAIEEAKEELTDAVQDIADEAAESAREAAASAADSELSAQNAAASEGILNFYVDYVVPRFVIANNRLYIKDNATQSFMVANNRLYILNPA
jgi:hypothetical protein